jgi:hypothetical protein
MHIMQLPGRCTTGRLSIGGIADCPRSRLKNELLNNSHEPVERPALLAIAIEIAGARSDGLDFERRIGEIRMRAPT